jgi:dolichyl-phosphate-mannose-protein mannosyltransferase
MFDFVTFRMKKMQWVLVAGIAFVVIYVYYLFSPLTYGVEQSEASCNALKWRSSWDFNCPSAE